MAAITVRYWAGARRAAGVDEEQRSEDSIGELRAAMARRGELAALSEVVSFLVDSTPAGDATRLYDGAVVDVLPPFAGG
jgi:molybdopterin converting factor small subunit